MAADTKTGGKDATTAVVPGRHALSIGNPETALPAGWRWAKLTDLARLESGHTPSRKRPEYWNGDVPWIGIKDATSNHGRVIADTLQHASELGIENSSARVLPANTVCVSRTASVGYVIAMGAPMATSQDFVNWVCIERELSWRLLMYVLLSETEALRRFAYGTTHQTIYFPEVKAFHIARPPLAEQQAVVSVLSALDGKIESNARVVNGILDVARARVRGSVENTESTSFGDHVEFKNRFRVPLSSTQRRAMPGDVPYYGATGVFDRVDRSLFDEVLVLVGEDGSVVQEHGFPVTQYIWGKAWVNNHAHVVTGREISTELAYLAIERADVRSLVTGAVQPKLNMGNLKRVEVRVPTGAALAAVEGAIKPLFGTLRALKNEARTLTTIRDALLPKLVSGQIRVPLSDDPEEGVGAAVKELDRQADA